jgi:transcriptional regulator with XRE-family HTH domain
VQPADLRARRKELGAFLRSRREAITPEAAGLERGARRIARGLRREEVARLANIGVVWYTWLEQGRTVRPSSEVLTRITRILRLSPEETVYVFSLAERQIVPWGELATAVTSDVQAMLDAFTGSAFVVNARMDHLAWNRQAAAVYDFSIGTEWKSQNHIWRMFKDQQLRRIVRNWEDMAPGPVAIFRSLYAQHGADPRIDELLSALADSPEFVRAWSAKIVGRGPSTLIHFDTTAGAIAVRSMTFEPPAIPGVVVFLQTPVDHESFDALRRLSASSPH